MKLESKVALITGGSRGIGRATAERFAAEGARVVVNCLHRRSQAEAVVRAIGAERAVVVQADVSSEAGARDLVAEALRVFGRIDVLVNNAGVLLRGSHWTDDAAIWRTTLDTNLMGTWWVTREAAPAMDRSGGGAVVNVSSIYGVVGSVAALAYSASKAGLLSLTTALAKDLAPSIRVNAVAPGNVLTDMTSTAAPDVVTAFERETPLQRSAQPDEIAAAILFLGSGEASFVTGQVLVVDGGYGLK